MIRTRSFPQDTSSVAMARAFVADTLRGLPGALSSTAALIVSELATNAIRHARMGFTVRIETTEARLRAEVSDEGGGQPRVRSPEPLDPAGRGLQIVDSLSEDWGVVPRAGGKSVWFTLDLSEERVHRAG